MPHIGEFQTPPPKQGQFTPTDTSGAGLVLTTALCDWILTGGLVHARYRISYPATADVSNAALSLPFQHATGASGLAATGTVQSGVAQAAHWFIDQGSSELRIYPVGSFTRARNVDLSNQPLYFSVTYKPVP
jgi:hypothetical protein